MPEILEKFIRYIEAAGVSENTRQAYQRDIRQLIIWLEARDIQDPGSVSGADLQSYAEMMEKEGKSAATISRNIASIKKFFAFAYANGYVFSNPAEGLHGPKVIRKTPSVLSQSEIKKLLSVPDTATRKGIRDKAILIMLTETGICVSEIISLKCADADLGMRTVYAGEERRPIVISRHASAVLRDYLKVRSEFLTDPSADDDTFFLSYAGGQMTRQGLWKIIRSCGRSAGIREITPQILRHSFAVSALKSGKDVTSLQKLLGHRSRSGSLEYQNLVSLI